ncbi:MAG: RHS repeat-associated core domain-containing protein [Phycisphaeraceae bacterium]|nr:RHS repeat-associated core domain-containing protein [Phycisphaeraceae bacterium]
MPLRRAIHVMIVALLALLASGITTTPAHGTLVRGPDEHVHATGTVDFSDQLILSGSYASALPRGLGLSTNGNVIGFTGHVFDAETGLLLARLRVHDAVLLGRWLSRDPAGFVDGMNLHVYVRGNPLVWWDPLGMWIFRWLGLATDQSAPGAPTTGWDVADAYVTGFVKGIGEAAANTKAGIEGGLKTVIIGGGVTLGLVDERHLDEVPTLQDIVRKIYDGGRGLVGDDMWRAILESSTRSGVSVNQTLGVGSR